MDKSPQFDFLVEYVLALLDANNIVLDDAQKQVYVPQIAAQASMRLGLEIMPKLSEEQAKQMAAMMENDTTAEEWRDFWISAVPTFEEDVKRVLSGFTEKVKAILAKE